MPGGLPWSKDWQDRNLSNMLEAALSPAEMGILYLCRLKAAQNRDMGRLLIDGKPATRSALLAFLKRQYGDNVTDALSNLFDRKFLVLRGKGKYVVVDPWAIDNDDTPEALRKRRQREKEKVEREEKERLEAENKAAQEKEFLKNKFLKNVDGIRKPNSIESNGVDGHAHVTHREEKTETEKRSYINTESETETEGACADAGCNVIPFSCPPSRGCAPSPSAPPFSVSESRGSSAMQDRYADETEERRGEERIEETRTSTRSRESRWGGAEGEGAHSWRTVDIYIDPFSAAILIGGEDTTDFASSCKNGLRDLGRDLFSQAVSELKQERMAGKAKNPARLFNAILNRFRQEAGIDQRKSKRVM